MRFSNQEYVFVLCTYKSLLRINPYQLITDTKVYKHSANT